MDRVQANGSGRAVPSPRENRILAGLPSADYERIEPALESVRLTRGDLLGDEQAPSGHRFLFITRGVVSLLYTTADGEAAELAMIGPEGGVGLEFVLAGYALPGERIVQLPGFAWSLRASRLRDEFARAETLQRSLLWFSQSLMTQMAQTVVCNRHHSVEQQLVRWVLLSLDRLAGSDLDMTQESIANMLGVRRAGVTEAAGRLQREGLLELNRGRIRVYDRAGLEARSCECYRVIRAQYDRFPGESGAPGAPDA